jgi:predicted GIY-YIG superfamily endonuclease
MHYVYVLRSTSDDGFYIGYSANLRKRFEQHAKGDAFATSYRGPWKLIYYEVIWNNPMLSDGNATSKAVRAEGF